MELLRYTPSFCPDNLERGQDVLLEIDIQGAMQVKRSSLKGIYFYSSSQ